MDELLAPCDDALNISLGIHSTYRYAGYMYSQHGGEHARPKLRRQMSCMTSFAKNLGPHEFIKYSTGS